MRRRELSWAGAFCAALAALPSGVFAYEGGTSRDQAVTMNGYWRLGVNTAPSFVDPASDEQGYGQFGDQPTSRHAHRPNYFWLRLGRELDDGAEVAFKVDSEAQALPHATNRWGSEGDAEAQTLRVRDLYLRLPVGGDGGIWAGSRFLEFEDIRLFDFLNHFNVNGYGVGGDWRGALGALSFTRDGRRLNSTLLARYEYSLGSNAAIKPMFRWERYGAAPRAGDDPAIKGAAGYSVGGVYSRWGDWGWGNTHVWYQSRPVDTTGAKSGHDASWVVADSSNLDWGWGGLMTALMAQWETYQSAREVYVARGGSIARDGDETTRDTVKVAIGAQPVWYVTDRLHAAFDVQVTHKTRKTSNTDFDQALLTPILRYTMNRSALGNPQIYTSVTYGKYDWKTKRTSDGDATDRLWTAQTGFECWF